MSAAPDPGAPRLPPAAPAATDLDLLVDRVEVACGELLDLDRARIAHVIEEALWQAGWLVRRGAAVELPQIGTLLRRADGTVIYRAARELLEDAL